MDKILKATKDSLKTDIVDFKAGDTVSVGVKVIEGSRSRVQLFEGVVIARSAGAGLSKTFTVRKISNGVGVERIFPFHSPNIENIKVLKRGKVRRAKLYYLRERQGKSARIAERSSGRSTESEDNKITEKKQTKAKKVPAEKIENKDDNS